MLSFGCARSRRLLRQSRVRESPNLAFLFHRTTPPLCLANGHSLLLKADSGGTSQKTTAHCFVTYSVGHLKPQTVHSAPEELKSDCLTAETRSSPRSQTVNSAFKRSHSFDRSRIVPSCSIGLEFHSRRSEQIVYDRHISTVETCTTGIHIIHKCNTSGGIEPPTTF